MNIISVSRRSDIPACYGEWFCDILDKGECEVILPFTGRKISVSLKKEDVYAFIFWSKNYQPFVRILEKVRDRGYKFYLNYTVNNYPAYIEPLVIRPEKIIENLVELSGKYKIFWRYDPVYISKKLNREFHLKNFAYLCGKIRSKADRVIINFIQEYAKVIKRIKNTFVPEEYKYVDISIDEKLELAHELKKIAASNDLQIYSCTKILYNGGITLKSHCVDKFLVEELTGLEIPVNESPNYPGCHCHKSIDIGKYGACGNGCIYCYAKK